MVPPPVLNPFRNPGAGNFRSGNALKAASRILVGVDNDNLRGAGGRISGPVFLQPALNLVMKSASENILSVQVRRRQRVAEENQLPGRTQHFRAAIPELAENRAIEILKTRSAG